MKFGTPFPEINFLQSYVNVFHLTWIVPLYYLVKHEMFIAHMLRLIVTERNLRSEWSWLLSIFVWSVLCCDQNVGSKTEQLLSHWADTASTWRLVWHEHGSWGNEGETRYGSKAHLSAVCCTQQEEDQQPDSNGHGSHATCCTCQAWGYFKCSL